MAIKGKMANIKSLQQAAMRRIAESQAQYSKKKGALDRGLDLGDKLIDVAKYIPGLGEIAQVADLAYTPLKGEISSRYAPDKSPIKKAEGTWGYGYADPIIEGLTEVEKEEKSQGWGDFISNIRKQFGTSEFGADFKSGEEDFNIFDLFGGGGDRSQYQPYTGDLSPEFLKQFSGNGGGDLSQFLKNGGKIPKYRKGKKVRQQRKLNRFAQHYGMPLDTEQDQTDALVQMDKLKQLVEDFESPESALSGLSRLGDQDSAGKETAEKLFSILQGQEMNYPQWRPGMTAEEREPYMAGTPWNITDIISAISEGKEHKGKYAGGGMVESGTPTIADYFSMQGKTLGGSSIESMRGK